MTIGNVPGYERWNRSNQCVRLIAWLPTENGKPSNPGFADLEEGVSKKDGDIKRKIIHDVLRKVLSCFQEAEREGVNMLCPDGMRRRCHPVLCQYIGDYPEQTLLCCILYKSCPRCMIPPYYEMIVEESNDVVKGPKPTTKEPRETAKRKKRQRDEKDDGSATESRTKRMKPGSGDVFHKYNLRTKVQHQTSRAKYEQDGDIEALKAEGLKPDHPFTELFDHSDIHSIIAPDILHQVSKMLFDYLYSWILEFISKTHKESNAAIEKEIDGRFSQLPPYPGLKSFRGGISVTQRWTGNEYKAMARVILPVVQDLLDEKMVALVRAYLDIIQLSQYTSHTEQTVEYLRRAIDEYTELRSNATGPLVERGILAQGWWTPKQHWLQHYPDWIPLKGPLPFCSTDRSEALHKMHKTDYRKSNKNPLDFHRFILRNESFKIAIDRFESSLPPNEVYRASHPLPAADDDDDNDAASDRNDDAADETIEDRDYTTPFIHSRVDNLDTRTLLLGARWKGLRDIDAMERDLELKDLVNETKKCLRWIRSNGTQTSRQRLEGWQNEEIVQISGYTRCDLQYPEVHDTSVCITEIIRSNPSYGKSEQKAPRYDTVLVRWTKEEGAHCMSNRRIGRVLLLFSTVCNVTGKKIEMAYVEWMTLASNTWDKKTEMFRVKKSGEYAVIGVGSIERGVHLVPVFQGFRTAMAETEQPSLEVYRDFFINNWIDGHMYNTIFALNEKFQD
jgi:Plavaka transposase